MARKFYVVSFYLKDLQQYRVAHKPKALIQDARADVVEVMLLSYPKLRFTIVKMSPILNF